jgi:hypothetical protein
MNNTGYRILMRVAAILALLSATALGVAVELYF